MKKVICDICKCEVTQNNIKKHLHAHSTHDIDYKPFSGKTLKCKFCGLSYIDLTSGERNTHTKYCDSNPKKQQTLDKLKQIHRYRTHQWNEGLTGKDDERIKQSGLTYSKRIKEGLITPSFKGKHHSEKTKKQMSISALNSGHQRVCKSSLYYTKKDGTVVRLDSKYEERVAKILDKHCIEWIRPSSLKWIDVKGVEHNYFPDFYLSEYDIYLDPKNEYCFRVQKEKIDYIKHHHTNVYFLHDVEIKEENVLNLLIG